MCTPVIGGRQQSAKLVVSVKMIGCNTKLGRNGDTDIIHERNTSDMDMFPVKRILEELDDVLSDSILG